MQDGNGIVTDVANKLVQFEVVLDAHFKDGVILLYGDEAEVFMFMTRTMHCTGFMLIVVQGNQVHPKCPVSASYTKASQLLPAKCRILICD